MSDQPITITDYHARTTEAYLLINVWDIYREHVEHVQELFEAEYYFMTVVLRVCTEANEILDKRIDFDNYPGMFDYEHADYNTEDSLAYALFNAIMRDLPVDKVVNHWIEENVKEYVRAP